MSSTSRFHLPALVLALSLPLGAQLGAQDGAQDDEIVQQAQLEAWTTSIKKDVEELRGQAFKRPVEVSTANLEQFISYVKDRMEKDTSSEELAAQEMVAKMLGVVPVEMSLLGTYMEMIESQVGGFYDPTTESFCLMERFGGDLARIVLAHELTHALDDQYYDIDGTLAKIENNSDQSFAYHAVVEGSGTATQNAWIKAHAKEIDLMALASSGDIDTAGMDKAPPFLWKPMLGSYMLGAAFLVRSSSILAGQSKAASAADVHIAFRRPPLSSEQILHPEKFWDAEKRDDPVQVRIDLAGVPADWNLLGEDTLGEMGLGFVIEPQRKRRGLESQLQIFTTKFTYPASDGWGGDRYVLLGRGSARVLILRTVWDSEADRVEFSQAIAGEKSAIAGALMALAGDAGEVRISTREDAGLRLNLALGFNLSEADFGALLTALGQ